MIVGKADFTEALKVNALRENGPLIYNGIGVLISKGSNTNSVCRFKYRLPLFLV